MRLKELNQGDIFKISEGNLKGEMFIVSELGITYGQEYISNLISLKTGCCIAIDNNTLVDIIKYNTTDSISLEIRTENSRLQLVKAIKELTGWGLKESKDYMDDNTVEFNHSDIIMEIKVTLHKIDYSNYLKFNNDNVIIIKL